MFNEVGIIAKYYTYTHKFDNAKWSIELFPNHANQYRCIHFIKLIQTMCCATVHTFQLNQILRPSDMPNSSQEWYVLLVDSLFDRIIKVGTFWWANVHAGKQVAISHDLLLFQRPDKNTFVMWAFTPKKLQMNFLSITYARRLLQHWGCRRTILISRPVLESSCKTWSTLFK